MSMDRKIEKSRKPLIIKSSMAIGAMLLVGVVGKQILDDSSISTFRVDRDRITVSAVSQGAFEDFIPVRGTVTPLKSVYLDAIEGGRVERVLAEEGTMVEAGQPIVELSNTSLQLDVISREADVTEQSNNLRNTRLDLERNRLQLKRSLAEIDYNILTLEKRSERNQRMFEQDAIPESNVVDTLDQLQHYRNLRVLTLESQQQEEAMREVQMESMELQLKQMEVNLDYARSSLDNLTVKAPISGQLTSLDAELGQSKGRGETLGQIDIVDQYKLSVLIDEFYVIRTQVGQRGEFTLSGRPYALEVSKVYPEIVNGQFEIDMEFRGLVPTDIRRGQTLQVRVQLGDASEAVLLPRGGFFQDTGGNWVFVLSEDGTEALRRDIRLGRRNSEYFEVLEGLEPGERVITSDYAAYTDIDRIQFN